MVTFTKRLASENPLELHNIARLLPRAAALQQKSGVRYCLGGAGAESRMQHYPELLDEACRLLTALRAHGLRPRDKVILSVERPHEFLTGFWACLLGGFVPCPMAALHGDPDRWTAQLTHVNQLLDGPLLLTSEALAAELPQIPGLAVATLESLSGGEPATRLHDAAPDDLAVLMLTSGSTGHAKAVMLSHANLLASMSAQNGYHQLAASDTTLNWVSFDHVAALLEFHLLPLFTGSSQLHVEPSVILGEPLEFLRLISRHQVTMTFTPNFLLGLLNAAVDRLPPSEVLDLAPLRQLISGGEAVVCATRTAFLKNFQPYGLDRCVLRPAFGMTETCAGSIYSSGFPDSDIGEEFANLGTPVEGLHIRVTDEHDNPLPEGQAGELQLIGPMITRGYYNNADATSAAFTADGWFHSGDLGRIDNGRLTLVGRSKDSIIVSGVNYFSHDIETVLQRLDGVAASYVAAFPTRREGNDTEQLVIAFHPEIPPDDEAGLYRVLTAVRSSVVMHWGFRPSLILALPHGAFPKTSLGKIQRALLRTRLEAGEFEEAIPLGRRADAAPARRLRTTGRKDRGGHRGDLRRAVRHRHDRRQRHGQFLRSRWHLTGHPPITQPRRATLRSPGPADHHRADRSNRTYARSPSGRQRTVRYA